MLKETTSNQAPQLHSAVLMVAPVDCWEALAARITQDYHPGDVWMPEDLQAPLNVQNIRSLHPFAATAAFAGKKMVIIPQANTLSKEIANTLLKLLEEPPLGLQVILLGEHARTLSTIRSRVQLVYANTGTGGTKDSVDSIFKRWQALLNKYDVTDPEQRRIQQQLLYLAPLVHKTVNFDTLEQAYTP